MVSCGCDIPVVQHALQVLCGRIKRGADSIGVTQPGETLRAALRGATAAAHDLLDSSVREASGWNSRGNYAQFLSIQLAARTPIETWLAVHAPPDLTPPPQCPLIMRDLAALGVVTLPASEEFTITPMLTGAKGGEALGIAWALAGSALGNAAILKQVQRASRADPGGEWPQVFLGDPAMLTYWKALRSKIERPAPVDVVTAASLGANAVFDHFIKHTPRQPERLLQPAKSLTELAP